MNTTGNYQLNQWEASDRILRTDFNADNSKIDAALKANADTAASAARYRLLKDITTTAAASSVEVDMTDVDWSRWQNVHVDALANGGTLVYLYPNAEGEWIYWTGLPNSAAGGVMVGQSSTLFAPRLTFAVGKQPARIAEVLNRGFSFYACASGGGALSYAQITKLRFTTASAGSSVYAGCRFLVWGEE